MTKQEYLVALAVRIRSRSREEVYAGLLWIIDQHGWKRGCVAFKFKELFGTWPERMEYIQPELPSVDLEEWIYRRQELRSIEMSRDKAKKKRMTNGAPAGSA